jgi:hypothetical protein
MFSNNGNYEKDIVRFSGVPYEVSYTGENIVAVTIYDKRQWFFVTDTIPNLETAFIKDSNSDGKSSFSSKSS